MARGCTRGAESECLVLVISQVSNAGELAPKEMGPWGRLIRAAILSSEGNMANRKQQGCPEVKDWASSPSSSLLKTNGSAEPYFKLKDTVLWKAKPPVFQLCQHFSPLLGWIIRDCHFCKSQMVGYWQFHEAQSNSSWATVAPRRVGQSRFRPLCCMLIWVPQKSRCQKRIKHEGILLGEMPVGKEIEECRESHQNLVLDRSQEKQRGKEGRVQVS